MANGGPVGGGGGGGIKTVGLTLPSIFSVTGSPLTKPGGTFAVTLATQAANLVWVGPSTGSAAAPTFRALVTADIPATLDNKTLTTPTIASFVNATHNHQNAAGGGQLNASSVFSSGTLPAAQMPALTGDITTVAGAVATTLATVNANVGSFALATVTVNAKGLTTAASAASTTGSGNVVLASSPTITTPTIAKLANLTTNGFVKTSGGDGTLSVDTSTYLTANQTITLSGVVTGSGATAITTAFNSSTGSGAVVLATSPTITTPTIADLTNMTHSHQNAAGGGSLSAAAIGSGTLALARGGTNADLSATGGSNQFLKQSSSGAALTVAAILSADLTSALTTPPIIGGTSQAAIKGTIVTATTRLVSPILAPISDSATAFLLTLADGTTAVVTVDTSSRRVGIGAPPEALLHVSEPTNFGVTKGIALSNSTTSWRMYIPSAGLFAIGASDGTNFWQARYTPSGTSPTNLFTSPNAAATDGIVVAVRGSSGQTGSLQAWQTSGLATVASISGVGVLTVAPIDAVTAAVTNAAILAHATSGVPAPNYGTGLLFTGFDNPTSGGQQNMAVVESYWNDAAHATRKAYGVVAAYDTARRNVIGWGASGSLSMLGFHDKALAPIVQAVLATGAGATVDNVITALQNLGLVKQS